VLHTRGRSLRYRKAVGKGQAFANRARLAIGFWFLLIAEC
jgi:hypothetical protein